MMNEKSVALTVFALQSSQRYRSSPRYRLCGAKVTSLFGQPGREIAVGRAVPIDHVAPRKAVPSMLADSNRPAARQSAMPLGNTSTPQANSSGKTSRTTS